jgi:hypothetical protein
MFPTTTLTAQLARQHQADLRAAAAPRELARLFGRPQPAPTRPAPRRGGITAVPSLPSEQVPTSPRPAGGHAAHAA